MKHAYKPLNRPAPFAGLPAGWIFLEAPPDLVHLRRDIPASTWMYGVIGYDQKLDPDVAKRHDLEYLGER